MSPLHRRIPWLPGSGRGKRPTAGREEAELGERDARARSTGRQGDPAGARDQFAGLLPVRERVLGASHPDTLTTRRELDRWTSKAAGRAGIG